MFKCDYWMTDSYRKELGQNNWKQLNFNFKRISRQLQVFMQFSRTTENSKLVRIQKGRFHVKIVHAIQLFIQIETLPSIFKDILSDMLHCKITHFCYKIENACN